MEQILLGVGMMVAGMVVMLSACGVSGGPKARRARLAALGRWPAILVLGVAVGLLIAGFLETLLWVEDHNTKPVLSRDVFLVVTSLGIGVYGSWLLWKFVSLIDTVDTDVASLREMLPNPSEEKVAPRQPTTAQDEAAHRILDERRRTLRRSRIIGGGGAVLLVAFGGLIALRSGARFAGGTFGLMTAAYFNYRVIASWFRARPRSLLLLRRFTGFDDKRFVVARVLGEACSGLAVPITIQDDSFRGDTPIALEALLRYIGIPLAFVIPLLLLMLAPRSFFLAFGEIGAVASVLALGAALCWLCVSVAKRRAVIRAGVADYRPRLERFFQSVRTRMVMDSGTRVMRFSNDAWRDAIELCLDKVDCVVVDITDINENVAWEVGAVYRRFPPEAVLLIWEYEASGQPADDGGSIPAALLDRLSLVVPREKIERSRRVARPGEMSLLAVAVMTEIWTVQIAQCLAANAHREAPAAAQNG